MKYRSRTEIINKIPNKYDAVMAISNRVKMLAEGKKRLVEEYDEDMIKVAMEEIATGALEVEIKNKERK